MARRRGRGGVRGSLRSGPRVDVVVVRNQADVQIIVDANPEEEEDEESPIRRGKGRRKRGTSRRDEDEPEDDDNPDEEEEETVLTEGYFESQSTRARGSGKTLKELNMTLVRSESGHVGDSYLQWKGADGLQDMDTKGQLLFPKWFNIMNEGLNLVIYGLGSKRLLLDRFCSEWLSDEHHLVIHGFFAELTLKQVALTLKDAMNANGSDEEFLLEAANQLDYHLYLVIHSLDLLLSSSSKLKHLIIGLVSMSNQMLHLIASVDHVNCGHLWSSKEANMINLIWFNCPTLRTYSLEKGYSSGISSKGNSTTSLAQSLTFSSIEHVYESLTPNAQQIFLMILRFYLDKKTLQEARGDVPRGMSEGSDSEDEMATGRNRVMDRDVDGLAFCELYRNCREEFLVNSELTLKAQLTEFRDHQIIRFVKRTDGTQVVHLLLDLKLAQKFVNKVSQ